MQLAAFEVVGLKGRLMMLAYRPGLQLYGLSVGKRLCNTQFSSCAVDVTAFQAQCLPATASVGSQWSADPHHPLEHVQEDDPHRTSQYC